MELTCPPVNRSVGFEVPLRPRAPAAAVRSSPSRSYGLRSIIEAIEVQAVCCPC